MKSNSLVIVVSVFLCIPAFFGWIFELGFVCHNGYAYAAEASNIKWMGGYTFGINGPLEIEPARSRAFLASGGGVYVIDISEPAYPVRISERLETPGIIRGLRRVSNYIYIASWKSGFEIWDVMWSPTLMSRTELPYSIVDVDDYLNYAVCISDTGYIYTIYVASVTDPLITGEGTLNGRPTALAIKDAVAYVATVDSGVRIVSLSSPSRPAEIGTIRPGEPIYSLIIEDNNLYLGGDGRLYLYNIATPNAPVLRGILETEYKITALCFNEGYLYCGAESGDTLYGIASYDVSEPETLSQLSFTQTNVPVSDMKIYSGYLICSLENKLQTFFISSPGTLEPSGEFITPGFLSRVWVKDRIGYLSYNAGGIRVLNMNNISNVFTTSELAEGSGGIDAAITDDYLYLLVEPQNIFVFDRRTTWNLTLLNVLQLPSRPYACDLREEYLFVADGDSGVIIFSRSNPVNLNRAGSIVPPGRVVDIKVNGELLFAACESSGLIIYNISDVANPALVSSLIFDGPVFGLALLGQYVFAGVYGDGIRVVDISDFASPNVVGGFPVETPGGWLFSLADPLVYLADSTGNLFALDISNPILPNVSGTYRFPSPVVHLNSDSNFCYANLYGLGLQIVKFTGSITPPSMPIVLHPGWNLISLPTQNPHAYRDIFPFLTTPAYIYDTPNRRYVTSDTLYPGKGYWLLSFTDTTVSVTDRPLQSYHITIQSGWNMVGALSEECSADVYTSNPFILPPLYWYDRTHYERADSLAPGRGYWVLSMGVFETTISYPTCR